MEQNEHIAYAEILIFLLQKQRALERSVKALQASFLASSPTPDQLAAEIAESEQFLLESDTTEETICQYEAYIQSLASGKKPDVPDA